jgi:hypothetical protein
MGQIAYKFDYQAHAAGNILASALASSTNSAILQRSRAVHTATICH